MLNVLIIFGGISPEYDISLLSAAGVINNIDKNKYQITKLGITKDGKWFYTEADSSDIKNNQWINHPSNIEATISTNRFEHCLILYDGTKKEYDVVLPMLHGKNGEDGRIQGLFELASVPFVGPGLTASSNGMDKSLTKLLVDTINIPQADYVLLKSSDYTEKDIEIIENKFSYPVFVKPCSTGSSCGVSKATDRTSLKEAIKTAFSFDKKILIEEYIKGKEIEVAVIGEHPVYASVCGEIVPGNEFYDYNAKYFDNNSLLFIPARIDEKISDKIRKAAVDIFNVIECKSHSRVDFFVMEDGSFIFNEINTLPGFTDISMYPKLMMYSKGITYSELIDEMIELALEDYKNRPVGD